MYVTMQLHQKYQRMLTFLLHSLTSVYVASGKISVELLHPTMAWQTSALELLLELK